jgi:hypothetical protein
MEGSRVVSASRLGVYQASTPQHNPAQARASGAFAISTNSSIFVCLRRRTSPGFTAPCTTHNREVGDSNPPEAIRELLAGTPGA